MKPLPGGPPLLEYFLLPLAPAQCMLLFLMSQHFRSLMLSVTPKTQTLSEPFFGNSQFILATGVGAVNVHVCGDQSLLLFNVFYVLVGPPVSGSA